MSESERGPVQPREELWPPSARTPFRDLSKAVRIGSGLLLVATASMPVFQLHRFRDSEAIAASWLLKPLGANGYYTPTPIVWFRFDTRHGVGLLITPECSIALILVPLLLLAAILLTRPAIPVRRVLAGTLAAAAAVVIGNTARLGVIAWMIDQWGMRTGYGLGHTIIGSLISIVFVAASLWLLLGIAGRGRVSP